MFQCSSASRKFLNLHQRLRVAHPQCRFQCSSASRKFLNRGGIIVYEVDCFEGFSALQRAENSSIPNRNPIGRYENEVSVLFSEPKIPQSESENVWQSKRPCFSALQRAENSSIASIAPASIHISDRDDHASSFLSLPGASP